MSKTPLPLRADDMTVFTRALAKQLGDVSPSHLSLMNMVARSAGFQNVQHMRAVSAAQKRLESQAEDPPADARLVERTLHQFDSLGRLREWPAKRSVQTLALWGIWSSFPAKTVMTEKAVNACLAPEHLFQDPATLRRTMISCGLLSRKPDGSEYVRVEQKPDANARAVMKELSGRRRMRPAVPKGRSTA